MPDFHAMPKTDLALWILGMVSVEAEAYQQGDQKKADEICEKVDVAIEVWEVRFGDDPL